MDKILSVLAQLGFAPLKEKQKPTDASSAKPDKATDAIHELASQGDLVARALSRHAGGLLPHLSSPYPRLFYTLTPLRAGKQPATILAGHIIGPPAPVHRGVWYVCGP